MKLDLEFPEFQDPENSYGGTRIFVAAVQLYVK